MWKLAYCKIPSISPGLIEVRKHFWGGLVFGRAYVSEASGIPPHKKHSGKGAPPPLRFFCL